MAKWVYLFSEGNANMRELLGGKHAADGGQGQGRRAAGPLGTDPPCANPHQRAKGTDTVEQRLRLNGMAG